MRAEESSDAGAPCGDAVSDGGMEPWPVQLATALSDGGPELEGVRRVQGELARLGGRVPFRVVHDWYASTVVPMLVEAAARRGEDTGLLVAVGQLHARALKGERIEATEWTGALEPALREVYGSAYPYAEAHATASANAHAYAMANDYGAAEATRFAATYADLNTTANARSYAVANALANARAVALAYANADGQTYAATYPYARVNAYALACAGPDEGGGERAGEGVGEGRRAACGRLTDGFADSLARV
ncbi:SpcZ [Streptomyces sp. NPDC001415]